MKHTIGHPLIGTLFGNEKIQIKLTPDEYRLLISQKRSGEIVDIEFKGKKYQFIIRDGSFFQTGAHTKPLFILKPESIGSKDGNKKIVSYNLKELSRDGVLIESDRHARVLELQPISPEITPERFASEVLKKRIKRAALLLLVGSGIVGAGVLARKYDVSGSPKEGWIQNVGLSLENSSTSEHIIKAFQTPVDHLGLFNQLFFTSGSTSIDTLITQYNLDAETFASLNPQLSRDNSDKPLSVDTTIVLPSLPLYTVQEDDTWSSIARQHNVSEVVLTFVNSRTISAGDKIILPDAKHIKIINTYFETLNGQENSFTADGTLDIGQMLWIKHQRGISLEDTEIFYQLNNDVIPSGIEGDMIMEWVPPRGTIIQMPTRDQLGKSPVIEEAHTPDKDTTSATEQLQRAKELDESVYTYVCRHERSIDWTDEKWNEKMGKIRPGLDKKDKNGKYIFPNDGPTIDPGIDLGQVEIDHLSKIFGEIGLDTSVVEKIIQLAQVAREYKKNNGIGLKALSETYSDVSLTPEQLKKASIIAMHLYAEEYIYPQISKFKSAPIPVQQALLSIYYHRGPYWISTKYPQALKQLNEGNWYNATVLAMIKTPKGSSDEMKKRASEEYSTYISEKDGIGDPEQASVAPGKRLPLPFSAKDAYNFHLKFDTRAAPDLNFCASNPPVKKSLTPVYEELQKSYKKLKNMQSGSAEYAPLKAQCVALANLLDGDRHGLLYSYVQGKKSYGAKFQIPGAKKGQTSGVSPRARSYLGDCSTEVATGIIYIVADSIQDKYGIDFSTAEFDAAFNKPRGGFTQIFDMLVRTGAGKVYPRTQVYDKDGDILPSFQSKMEGKAAFSWLQSIGEHGGMLLSDGSICDAGVMHNKDGSGIGIREQHTMYRGKPIHSVTKGVCVIDHPEKLTVVMESHLRKIGKIPSEILASR